MPRPKRIDKHIRVLGILWLVMSALRVIPGVLLLALKNVALPFLPFPARVLFAPIAGIFGILILATAVGGLAVGFGLLDRQPWARTLALVLGVIALLHFPFGTALGVYTLWVLLPQQSEQEWRRLSRTA